MVGIDLQEFESGALALIIVIETYKYIGWDVTPNQSGRKNVGRIRERPMRTSSITRSTIGVCKSSLFSSSVNPFVVASLSAPVSEKRFQSAALSIMRSSRTPRSLTGGFSYNRSRDVGGQKSSLIFLPSRASTICSVAPPRKLAKYRGLLPR